MPLFWKPYKSEFTQFLDELKNKNPQLEAQQRAFLCSEKDAL